MALDGGTHVISDLEGFGHGFHDTNLWLAILTRNALSQNFYSGEAWNSFNGLLRLLTGFLFGLGVAWFLYPYLQAEFPGTAQSTVAQQKEFEDNSKHSVWWLFSVLAVLLLTLGCVVIRLIMGGVIGL